MITKARSQIEERIYLLMKKEFPTFIIKQNESIKIGNKYLYVDIYIEKPIRIAIEVSPAYHKKFNPFFDKSWNQFWTRTANDKKKRKWASENEFIFIELDDSQLYLPDDEIIKIIRSYIK